MPSAQGRGGGKGDWVPPGSLIADRVPFLITLATGWMPLVQNKTSSVRSICYVQSASPGPARGEMDFYLVSLIPPLCETLSLPVYTIPKATNPSPRGLWEGRKPLGQRFSEAGRAGNYRETTAAVSCWVRHMGGQSPEGRNPLHVLKWHLGHRTGWEGEVSSLTRQRSPVGTQWKEDRSSLQAYAEIFVLCLPPGTPLETLPSS